MKAILTKFAVLLFITMPTAYANLNDCVVHPKLYPRPSDNSIVLDVSQCHLSDADMPILLNKLRSMGVSITEIKMNDNNITDNGVKLLPKFPFTGSTAIDLSSNKLTDKSTSTLMEIPNLQTLKLDSNSIKDTGADTLSYSKTIQILSLAHNKLSVVGVESFDRDDYLESLDVSYNSLDNYSLQYLSHSLKKLNIKATHIEYDTVHRILCHYPNLISVDVSDNDLSHVGAVQCEESGYQLQAVNFSAVGIKISSFFEFFNKDLFPNLISVNLSHNNLSDVDVKYFIEHMPAMRALDLSDNAIGSLGAVALASYSSIKQLDLHNNGIADTGALALATQRFDSLNLGKNQIGEVGLDALKQAHNRGAILDLDVTGNPGAKNLQSE